MSVFAKRSLSRRMLAAGLLFMLAACESGTNLAPSKPFADHPPPEPTVAITDSETNIAAAYYRRIETTYLSQGRLRTDHGGRDTPFTAADLARNVLAIALHDEFSERGGRLVAGGGESRLHLWTKPIRFSVEFGASVPLDQRRTDRAKVQGFFAQLSQLTGVPIRMSADRPNFLILIDNPPERKMSRARLLGFAPGTSEAALRSVVAMPPATYCTAFSYSSGQNPRYDKALVVVRAELPDLMREACLQEEMAQALGLVNDSPKARPSIFNDDQEFALLTRQDELMLRLLYDPRLRPGMTLPEARPVIETIAAELVPGDS